MSLFSVSSLLLATCAFGLALIILKFGRAKVHKLWTLFHFSIFVWATGVFLVSLSPNQPIAIGWWKFAHIGGLFISVFFYHTVYVFCNLKNKKILIFLYLQALIFITAIFTSFFINSVNLKFGLLFYNKANLFYTIGFLFWLVGVILGHYELILSYKTATSINRQKISYLLFGFLVGFSGGITYFLPMFNINFYPIGNFTIPIYCILSTYAILKYQILDIKVAITRVGIFFLVYIFVLGVPFLIGLKTLGIGKWLVPVSLSTLFASIGPFIYLIYKKEQKIGYCRNSDAIKLPYARHQREWVKSRI